jgi:putative hydrolase of the HAD superfamily
MSFLVGGRHQRKGAVGRRLALPGIAMIRAVIFDFGRVISVQKPPSLFRTYEGDLGLAPGTINTIMFASRTWQDALLGRTTVEEFWRSIGPALGLNTAAQIEAFRRRYHADEAVDEGVLHVIRRLRGRCKLAVLSNSPPGLARWLEDWEILDLFDVVFCSGDEGIVKPDPRAFVLTLERLGTSPGEAVFIDDTQEHVEAARALGLRGIAFRDAGKLEWDLADLLGPG